MDFALISASNDFNFLKKEGEGNVFWQT